MTDTEQINESVEVPVVIGGYYRSGTTMFANTLKHSTRNHHFIGVELQLRTFVLEYDKFCPKHNWLLIANLLEKQQQISVDKTSFIKLADFSKENTIDYIKQVPKNYRAGQAVKWLFDKVASENSKSSFTGKDNFAEIYYERLQKKFGKFKLIILVRDPRSVISSNIYMGSFPNRNTDHLGSILRHLAGWIINVNTSIRLQKKYPEYVKIIKYEDLINNDKKVMNTISNIFNSKISKLDPSKMKYRFSTYKNSQKDKFYDNNNKFRENLSDDEIQIIEQIAAREMNYFSYNNIIKKGKNLFLYRILFNILRGICLISPPFSVFLSNIVFIKKYYLSWLRNKITYYLVVTRIISPNILRTEVLFNKGNPLGIIYKTYE